MTKDAIRFCIKRKQWCDNPELNEMLYLHHKGFGEIRNLDDFTEITTLFLESNALAKIENLEAQHHMRTLYLQNNMIGMSWNWLLL